MSSSLIVSTGTVADAPGYAQGVHGCVDSTGKLWDFQFRSASSTTLYARYSSDKGVTWNDPTNNTFTLAHANNGHGRQLGVSFKTISGHDVVWINVYYNNVAGTDYTNVIRATLSGTTLTWGTELGVDSNSETSAFIIAAPIAITSGGYVPIFDTAACPPPNNFFTTASSLNADTGSTAASSWANFNNSSGFSTSVTALTLIPFAAADKVMLLCDNGTPNNVNWGVQTAPGMSAPTAANVFGTNVSMAANDWGVCRRADTDLHCARYEGSSVFTHRRYNGTSFSAGQSIPSQTCKSGGGLAMASDGTNVWLFIIDSDAANTVRYCKWNGSSWGSWTAFETSTQVRNYLTAYYDSINSQINVSWAQTNGTNFDLTFEALSLGGGATYQDLGVSPSLGTTGVPLTQAAYQNTGATPASGATGLPLLPRAYQNTGPATALGTTGVFLTALVPQALGPGVSLAVTGTPLAAAVYQNVGQGNAAAPTGLPLGTTAYQGVGQGPSLGTTGLPLVAATYQTVTPGTATSATGLPLVARAYQNTGTAPSLSPTGLPLTGATYQGMAPAPGSGAATGVALTPRESQDMGVAPGTSTTGAVVVISLTAPGLSPAPGVAITGVASRWVASLGVGATPATTATGVALLPAAYTPLSPTPALGKTGEVSLLAAYQNLVPTPASAASGLPLVTRVTQGLGPAPSQAGSGVALALRIYLDLGSAPALGGSGVTITTSNVPPGLGIAPAVATSGVHLTLGPLVSVAPRVNGRLSLGFVVSGQVRYRTGS